MTEEIGAAAEPLVSGMSFDEAMTRAKAAHRIVDQWNQPGNDYKTEYVCSQGCGTFGTVFATRWAQHIIDAADALIAESTPSTPPAPKTGISDASESGSHG